jgi:hypothetical protein
MSLVLILLPDAKIDAFNENGITKGKNIIEFNLNICKHEKKHTYSLKPFAYD